MRIKVWVFSIEATDKAAGEVEGEPTIPISLRPWIFSTPLLILLLNAAVSLPAATTTIIPASLALLIALAVGSSGSLKPEPLPNDILMTSTFFSILFSIAAIISSSCAPLASLLLLKTTIGIICAWLATPSIPANLAKSLSGALAPAIPATCIP